MRALSYGGSIASARTSVLLTGPTEFSAEVGTLALSGDWQVGPLASFVPPVAGTLLLQGAFSQVIDMPPARGELRNLIVQKSAGTASLADHAGTDLQVLENVSLNDGTVILSDRQVDLSGDLSISFIPLVTNSNTRWQLDGGGPVQTISDLSGQALGVLALEPGTTAVMEASPSSTRLRGIDIAQTASLQLANNSIELDTGASAVNAGSLLFQGTQSLDGNASLLNLGQIDFGFGTSTVAWQFSQQKSGSTRVANNAQALLNSVATLSGDIVVEDTGSLRLLASGASAIAGQGLALYVNEGGLLQALSDVSLDADSSLQGAGSLSGFSFLNQGLTVPGDSPGTLQVNGNYALAASSLLDVEYGAVGGAELDLLQVSGNLVLDGQLRLTPLSGFDVGSYVVASYGGVLVDNGLDLLDLPEGLAGEVEVDTIKREVRLLVSSTVLPELALSDTKIDFGIVAVGEFSETRQVRLGNVGNALLTVASITSPATPFLLDFHTCGAPPIELDAGGECDLQLRMQPVEKGLQTQSLTLDHDGVAGPVSLELSGTGAPSPPQVSPDTLDFGTIEVGEISPPLLLTVSNSASVELEIGSLSLLLGLEFDLDQDDCSGSTLAAGAQCEVSLRFAPAVHGPATDLLSVPSDAVESPAEAILEGSGSQDLIFRSGFETP